MASPAYRTVRATLDRIDPHRACEAETPVPPIHCLPTGHAKLLDGLTNLCQWGQTTQASGRSHAEFRTGSGSDVDRRRTSVWHRRFESIRQRDGSLLHGTPADDQPRSTRRDVCHHWRRNSTLHTATWHNYARVTSYDIAHKKQIVKCPFSTGRISSSDCRATRSTACLNAIRSARTQNQIAIQDARSTVLLHIGTATLDRMLARTFGARCHFVIQGETSVAIVHTRNGCDDVPAGCGRVAITYQCFAHDALRQISR